jgi:hypothetical protein
MLLKSKRIDSDKEPFPYPKGYILAPRNPVILTTIGALFLAASIIFYVWVIMLATGAIVIYTAPGEGVNAGTVLVTTLLPIAGAVALWIGVFRLRWQRAYLRRHGVLPVLIGSKQDS